MIETLNSVNVVLTTIVLVLIILYFSYVLLQKINRSLNKHKLTKKFGFNIKRLSNFVHEPLKCNAIPYRPGCCDIATCRQPGAQIDQYGNLQVYINPMDILNFSKPIGYYDDSSDPGGYELNTSVNEFHTDAEQN